MASATPCIESFYKAKTGKYALVTLKNRYGGKNLPDVAFYDMKTEPYYELPEDAFDAQGEDDPFLPALRPKRRPQPAGTYSKKPRRPESRWFWENC